MSSRAPDAVRASVTMSLGLPEAFALFAEGFGNWWLHHAYSASSTSDHYLGEGVRSTELAATRVDTSVLAGKVATWCR